MPIAKVNNIHLYYELHGKGPDLVLIQGLTANYRVWSLMLENLATHFRVLVFDNRGAGQSSQPKGGYTIDDMATDTAKLMEYLQIDSAFVVGHSMGGAIVQKLCILHPDKVKAAIIAGSIAQQPKTTGMQIETTTKLINAGVSQNLIFETVIPWIYGNTFLENPANMEAELKRMQSDPDLQTYDGYVGQVAALENYNTLSQLKKIHCPTLVLGGDEDLLTPVSCSEIIAEKIPKARLEIIKKCGHMFSREQPKAFMKHIISFFKNK